MIQYFVFNFSILVLFSVVSCSRYQQCSIRPLQRYPDAKARFSVIASLRESSGGKECDSIQDSTLMMLVAIDWVVSRLNNASLVPNVTYGYDLYDDCGIDRYSIHSALDALSYTFPSKLTSCSDNTSTYYLGILGPTRSQTAEKVLNIVRDSDIPVVSPTATSPDLRVSPNFFRTVPSDDDQANVFIDLIVKNKWNYVLAMYTDDKYGQNGISKIIERAKSRNICVKVIQGIKTTEIFDDKTYRDGIFSTMESHIENTTDNSLGVLYFGQRSVIQHFLSQMQLTSKLKTKLRNVKWIMSESVGTRATVFKNAEDVTNEAMTVSMAITKIPEVRAHIDNMITSPSDEIVDLIRNHGPPSTGDWEDAIASTLDATFALTTSLKAAFDTRCKGYKTICIGFDTYFNGDKDFEGNKLETMNNIRVDYRSLGTEISPTFFYNQERLVTFDSFGDLVPDNKSAIYTVSMYRADDKNKPMEKVGEYVDGVLQTNPDYPNAYATSTCQKGCETCLDAPRIPFEFIEGDVYIVGFFSLHRSSDDPLGCGEFRNLTFDVLSVEAFLNSIQESRSETGVRFGGIAFDDCYSSTRASMIMTDIFSGKLKIPSETNAIDPTKIVGVVGPFPSGVTVPVTFVFTGLGLPSVSYASTSPDLDDKEINYPYFLRTVPSDVDQANAMVKILIDMGWQSTGLVYVDSNYGSKGKDAFKAVANASGICVNSEIRVSVDDIRNENYQVSKELRRAVKAGTNLFVYFGTEGRMVDILSYIKDNPESGRSDKFIFIGSDDWADSRNIKDMFGNMVEGSVTFKIRTRATNTNFIDNLIEKTSSIDQASYWYKIFFRHHNKCHFKGDFVKTYPRECKTDTKFTQTNGILADGRVSHCILAVKALTKGIAQAKIDLCQGELSFPCLQYKRHLDKVSSIIAGVTLADNNDISFSVFDKNRNGDIGFQLLQIRKGEENYSYSEIGSYDNDNLVLKSEYLKSTLLSVAKCAASNPTNTLPSISRESDDFKLAEIIIIALGSVCVVLIIVIAAIIFRFYRSMSGMQKSLEETKHKLTYYNEIGTTKKHKHKQSSKKNGEIVFDNPVFTNQNGGLILPEPPGHHYLPLHESDQGRSGHRYDGNDLDILNQTSPKLITPPAEPLSLPISQRPDLPPRNVDKRFVSKSESDIHNSFPFIKPKMENYKISVTNQPRMGTAIQTTPTDSLHSLHSQGSVFGSQYPKNQAPSTPDEETLPSNAHNCKSSPSKSLPSSPRTHVHDKNLSHSRQEKRSPSHSSPLSHKSSIHSQFSGDTLHITGHMKSPQQKVKRLKSFSSEEPQKISRV